MAKKGKNRTTAEDAALHDEVVRLRKMTDRQLVEEFHRAAEPAEINVRKVKADGVATLLAALEEGRVKGVKSATTYKIATLAREMGLV